MCECFGHVFENNKKPSSENLLASCKEDCQDEADSNM